MTQQLARNIEGDFMMWEELWFGENVVQEVLYCFLLVMYYPSIPLAHVFCVLNDTFFYNM